MTSPMNHDPEDARRREEERAAQELADLLARLAKEQEERDR